MDGAAFLDNLDLSCLMEDLVGGEDLPLRCALADSGLNLGQRLVLLWYQSH